MADAELLLTVQGVDVTPYIWDWGSLRLSDSWNQHPALQVDLRCDFTQAASLSVPAFADVRLVNLLTGVVLFEGVQNTPLQQRTEDPQWIVTTISATGYGSLLDTSRLQSDVYVAPGYSSDPADYLTERIAMAVLRSSFADRRVPLPAYSVPYSGAYPLWTWGHSATLDGTFAKLSAASQALSDICALSWAGSADGLSRLETLPQWKVVPGYGIVIADPGAAFRGSAPVSLTAAGFGRPAGIVTSVDAGTIASAVEIDVTPAPGNHIIVDANNGTTRTNGYVVARGAVTGDPWWYDDATSDASISTQYFDRGPGSAPTTYTVTSPRMPHDLLVGHALTFDHPYWGTVTGTVQSVSTQFVGGQLDKAATGLPYMLDSGRSLDGTWTLDATAVSGTERHPRVHTVTVAGLSRTFLGSARAYGLGIHG